MTRGDGVKSSISVPLSQNIEMVQFKFDLQHHSRWKCICAKDQSPDIFCNFSVKTSWWAKLISSRLSVSTHSRWEYEENRQHLCRYGEELLSMIRGEFRLVFVRRRGWQGLVDSNAGHAEGEEPRHGAQVGQADGEVKLCGWVAATQWVFSLSYSFM